MPLAPDIQTSKDDADLLEEGSVVIFHDTESSSDSEPPELNVKGVSSPHVKSAPAPRCCPESPSTPIERGVREITGGSAPQQENAAILDISVINNRNTSVAVRHPLIITSLSLKSLGSVTSQDLFPPMQPRPSIFSQPTGGGPRSSRGRRPTSAKNGLEITAGPSPRPALTEKETPSKNLRRGVPLRRSRTTSTRKARPGTPGVGNPRDFRPRSAGRQERWEAIIARIEASNKTDKGSTITVRNDRMPKDMIGIHTDLADLDRHFGIIADEDGEELYVPD